MRKKLIAEFTPFTSGSEAVEALKPMRETLTEGANNARTRAHKDGALQFKRQTGRKVEVKNINTFALGQIKSDPITQILDGMQDDLSELIDLTAQEALLQGLNRKDQISLLSSRLDKSKNSFLVETWARTTTNMYYASGLSDVSNDPDVYDYLWGWTYQTVGDSRVRDEHQGYDGVSLPKNDPFWTFNKPPNGWNCRCTIIEEYQAEKIVEPEPVKVDGKEIPPLTDPNFLFDPAELTAPQS